MITNDLAYEDFRAELFLDNPVTMTRDQCRERVGQIFEYIKTHTDLPYTKVAYLLKQLDVYKGMSQAKAIQGS